MTTMLHKKFGRVEVLEESFSLIKILIADGKDFWVKRVDLREDTAPPVVIEEVVIPVEPIPFKQQPQQSTMRTDRREKTLSILPDVISPALVSYLLQCDYNLRVLWPRAIDTEARNYFADLDLLLPLDIDAIESGKRGGTTKQRGLAGEFVFPTPTNESLLAELQTFSVKPAKPGHSRVSRVRFIVALLTAGLQINRYKHILKKAA